MGSVIAIVLFLIVTIVSVITFQNWYGNFQSSQFVKAETQSDAIENLNIVDLIGNTLYVQSESDANVNSIQINKRDCGLAPSFSSGVNTVDVGTCLSGFSENKFDVVLVTSDTIYSKELYSSGGFEDILFARIFNSGNYYDVSKSLIETSDGSFGLLGHILNYSFYSDFWLIKTDSSGNELWNVSFNGGNGSSFGYSLVETSDGGFGLLGDFDNGVGFDFGLIKTDSSGNELWDVSFNGGNGSNGASYLVETSDGGFGLLGSVGNGVDFDIWLIKTDSSGNELWNVSFDGGNGNDDGESLIETSDGGFGLLGSVGNGVDSDIWLIKTDSSGNELWNVSFDGGNGDDIGKSLIETNEGSFGLLGDFDNGVDSDIWLIKTDSLGNELWNVSFFEGDLVYGSSLVETVDGGFGLLSSLVSDFYSNMSFWFIKTNSTGGTCDYSGGREC